MRFREVHLQYSWWVAGIILTVCVAAAIALGGCTFGQRLNNAVRTFKSDNPIAGIIPVDEDGDGTTDFLGVDLDRDNKVDTDSAGKPVEIPGSRDIYAGAETVDVEMGELITLFGAVIGIPGVGLLGSWWGRRKPIKQLTTLVHSFEMAKKDGAPEGTILLSKSLLELFLLESPGFIEVLDKMRAKSKAQRIASK